MLSLFYHQLLTTFVNISKNEQLHLRNGRRALNGNGFNFPLYDSHNINVLFFVYYTFQMKT